MDWIQGLIMLENSVIQITTGKLIGATVLPNSVLLIAGIVVWRFWRDKQTQLQTKTDELRDEIKYMKEQTTDKQTENHGSLSNTPSTSLNEPTDSTQIGLFEFLIEDNIQLRKHA